MWSPHHMAAPGVCITPHRPMCSDHSNAPISAPDTCSDHCHPNWLLLSPAQPSGQAQQIQSFINIDLYINSAQGTLTRALNLYWNYILHFMGHLNLCHSIKFSSHSSPHLDWTGGLTNLLWWRRLQMLIQLRAPVTSFVTWIGHPCAPHNASLLSPGTLEKCSGGWISNMDF